MTNDTILINMGNNQVIKEVGANDTLGKDIFKLVASVSLGEQDALKLTEALTIYITNRDGKVWDHAFNLGRTT